MQSVKNLLCCWPYGYSKEKCILSSCSRSVTEELVAVLSKRSSFEFKQLFDIVHENLRARNAASGGEEMLRLRAYEKLQNLVARAVRKNGKKYQRVAFGSRPGDCSANGHLAGVK